MPHSTSAEGISRHIGKAVDRAGSSAHRAIQERHTLSTGAGIVDAEGAICHAVGNSELTAKRLVEYALEHHKIGVEGQTMVIIDECQIIFNCRDFGRKDRGAWVTLFSQHRKRIVGMSRAGAPAELHPKSWTRKSTKGVQKSMGKELFSEELKLAVVQYVLEGHTCKEASEKFCVSCTPIEKWVNLYKLHGAKGLLSRNLVGRQKGFDGEFRLKVLQYKQEHHLSCTQTAMHFCLDVVTVCRWEKKFQKEGARGLMKKQATKGSEKRQKKQEQSELQQENKRLSEENYRLRMENDYLKKLNALIQKREKPE